MSKIKILRIITRLNVGGPAIHAVLLTGALNNDEFESELVCGSVSKGEGDMGYMAEACNVKPMRIPFLKREISPFSDAIAFYRIFRYMRRYKPDIIHTHTAKAGTLGRAAAILANVPVKIHTFHGNIFRGYFNEKKTRLFLSIEKTLAKFTNAIIAISPGQKREIVEEYQITDPDRCRVIRLGFDLQNFLNPGHKKRDYFRERLRFAKDDILVGIIGRLTSVKNHKMFINAADYIQKNAPGELRNRVKFLVIGDGELRSELVAYTRFKGLTEKIFFTGWVKDMSEVYCGLDIVALTSMNEGTPVSLIEAMASSRPVVSTDVGGVKDAVGKIGILVKSGDHEAMGKEMLDLVFSAEKRASLGAEGRDFVKGIYSKDRLILELGELYRELVMKKQKSKNKGVKR